jgi:uncharacterized membrane protein YbhN (UPF0104 family)
METEPDKIIKIGSKEFWKKILSVVSRVVVSAIVLYFVVSTVQWPKILGAYESADSRYIFAAALLLLANIGMRTLKWHIMLKSVKNAPTFKEAFGSVMLGISLGSFTPGEVGEFAGRALHIADAKRSHLVGLALLDKAQIFIVTSAAGAFGLAYITLSDSLLVAFTAIVIILLSVVSLLRLEILANIGHRLNASFFNKPWLTGILDGFTLLKPLQLSATALCTLAFHAVLVLQMFCLINAFTGITIAHAFIGTSAMMFMKSLLPISLGDLGIREAGSIFFFSIYNVSQAAALNASLLLFAINVFIPSLFGIYFLRHHEISTSKIFQFIKKKNDMAAQ